MILPLGRFNGCPETLMLVSLSSPWHNFAAELLKNHARCVIEGGWGMRILVAGGRKGNMLRGAFSFGGKSILEAFSFLNCFLP